jgi:predicted restriction endonuclease
VGALKELCGYRCQFPDCGVAIPKRRGGFYAEVAHIKPVHKGGKSVLGNLLVLCPNHHKEFDLGECSIEDQTPIFVRGRLNGKPFEISFPSKED